MQQNCSVCNTACQTCNNSQSCLTCAPSLFQLFTSGSSGFQCVPPTQCGSGQFGNVLSGKCDLCDSSCTACLGPSNLQCFTCAANYLLYQTSCVTQCPSGFFANQTTQMCDPCDATCLTCGSTAQYCLSCDPWGNVPYFLFQITTTNSSCLAADQIPPGFFLNLTTLAVQSCGNNGDFCDYTGACLACSADYWLQGTNCQANCDPGFYQGSYNVSAGAQVWSQQTA